MHFSNAAAELNITPPTLTIAIKKLESELGFVLFNRKTSKLTPAGSVLLAGAEKILTELETINKKLDDLSQDNDSIRIGIEATIFSKKFAILLSEYITCHSDISVGLFRFSSGLVEPYLDTDEINLGLVIKPPQLNDSYEYTDYPKIEYGLFLNRNHPLSKAKSVPAASLNDQSISILNFTEDIIEPMQRYFDHNGVNPHRGRITEKDSENVKSLISKGFGTAIMPMDMLNKTDDLVARRFDPPMLIDYVFVYVRKHTLSRQIRRMIKYMISKAS